MFGPLTRLGLIAATLTLVLDHASKLWLLFVLDLPEATYRQSTRPMLSHINVGTGQDMSIAELAALMAKVTGFSGKITYDRSRPDGTPRKLLDVSRLAGLGWQSSITLEDGIRQTYSWYLEHVADRPKK